VPERSEERLTRGGDRVVIGDSTGRVISFESQS
jgi:hypothetical protein